MSSTTPAAPHDVAARPGGQLLPREDPDIAAAVADTLQQQGVEIRLGARATDVRRASGHGDVVVTLADGDERRAQELLVATDDRR
ncbi:MAG: NAD-binding protein [Nocardioidaceae bacterium]